ncbi:MAG: hypothetical protein KGL39_11935 [Patescibacteria group bacterium]|nr:hypothetical protein [Patescibacteria group bacterium]
MNMLHTEAGEPLSDRERHVIAMRERGQSIEMIAKGLGISRQAAAYHQRRALAKLGITVGNRATYAVVMEAVERSREPRVPVLPQAFLDQAKADLAFVQLTDRCFHCGSSMLYQETDEFGTEIACLKCGRRCYQ